MCCSRRSPLAGEDYDLEVRADQLGIVGFGITEPELVFRKRGFDIIGELHGRATVLGAAASVDGHVRHVRRWLAHPHVRLR